MPCAPASMFARRASRRLFWWALAAAITTTTGSASAQPSAPAAEPAAPSHQTTFSIHVHVVEVDGTQVVPDTWVADQVAQANRVFEPTGVGFSIGHRAALHERHADLVSRQDRHRLGAYLGGSSIHVFVVRSLEDVDEPGRIRRGVHWRPRGYGRGKHFVVVSSIAGPEVLAHELGHFFGNRRHPPNEVGNIMSYEKGSGPGSFNEDQIERVERAAEAYLENGELIAVTPDADSTPEADTH